MNRVRRDLRSAGLATTLALLALAASASAGAPLKAATAGAGGGRTVVVGGVPTLAQESAPLRTLAPATKLALTVVLTPRDPAALAALATAVATPGSPSFRHYLSVASFAARFGAAPSAVADVRRTLRGDGLAPGALAADGLSMAVSGSAGAASRAFQVSLHDYRERSGREVYANASAPRLPAALAGKVQAILGLDDAQAEVPEGLETERAPKAVAHAASDSFPGGGGPQPCAAATAAAAAADSSEGGSHYTVNQIAAAYGMNGLYADGDFGSGVTIALYELESYADQASDLGAFQSCFGTDVTVNDTLVAGGPAPASPVSAETSVDLENLIAIAPAATIDVYQGPNTPNGQYDTLAQIVDQQPKSQQAQVISDSWGQCEQLFTEPANDDEYELDAENYLLEQAAIQGQSFVVSSGDRGSEGCNTGSAPTQSWGVESGPLAVDDPASQPYATGVGGTTLSAIGPPNIETSWNDIYFGASGGGISTVWRMPTYQAYSGVSGVINSYSTGSACPLSSSDPSPYCREVPDVAADASPHTGYMIYFDGAWLAVGGTSTAAPVWAGLVALADASGIATCKPSTPLGFLNPLLYEVAAGANHADAFDDITAGDNNPFLTGAYPATPGYDMDTGLGTPIATDGASPGLVEQLCDAAATGIGPTPTVTGLSAGEAPAGSTLTITGTGFTAYTGVAFGGVAATGVTDISSTQLKVTVPNGSGVVNVTAYTVAGPSAAGPQFTYAPTETITSPTSGATYTQTQQVAAAYACSASTGSTPSCAGSSANGRAIDTGTVGTHQFSVTATDSNGVTTSATVTYDVIAPPAIAITTPAAGATYTQGQTLTAQVACSTSAPATIASCAAPIANGVLIDTAALGTHTFSVQATDSNGVSATRTVSYAIVAPPQAILAKPANGAVFLRGQKVMAAFRCVATPPLSVSSCAATSANGKPIDTSANGTHHFTLSATDSNGVSTRADVSYTVVAVLPQIKAARESARRWLEHHPAAGGLPVGTTFSFAVDQAATVILHFKRSASGRLAAGRCVSPLAASAGAPACTRSLDAGALTFTATRGSNALSFSGQTSTGRLAPGTYTVTLQATGLSGRPSAAVSLRFTIAAPKG